MRHDTFPPGRTALCGEQCLITGPGEREVRRAELPILTRPWGSLNPQIQGWMGQGRKKGVSPPKAGTSLACPEPGRQARGRLGICVTQRVSLPPSPPPPLMPGPDLDECRVRSLCQHACRNTEGSYQCLCPTGYRLLPSGKNCQGELPRTGGTRAGLCGQGHPSPSPPSAIPVPPSHVREGQEDSLRGVK